jgi:hypothetical protein
VAVGGSPDRVRALSVRDRSRSPERQRRNLAKNPCRTKSWRGDRSSQKNETEENFTGSSDQKPRPEKSPRRRTETDRHTRKIKQKNVDSDEIEERAEHYNKQHT